MENFKELDWQTKYAEYLNVKENGLKKQSKEILEKLVDGFLSNTSESKRAIIDKVFTKAFLNGNYKQYIPYPLDAVFKNEINDWLREDPENPVPLRWTFDEENLKKALEIRPADQITLLLTGKIFSNRISMHQHDLSAGYSYVGNPETDLQDILFFKKMIPNIQDSEKRKELSETFLELETTAREDNRK